MKNNKLTNSILGGGQLLNKAFTLIELLAVIIILAVIALIATPVITNVIENASEEARKDSVIGYADSVRLSYAEESLINTGKPLKELASEKMQGDEVVCEYVKYDTKEYGTLLHSCKVEEKGNYCYFSGVVYNNESEECNNILSLIMNENIPYNTPNIYVSSQTPEGLEYAQSKEISVEYPSLKVVEEKYYIKSSEELEITTIGKCGNNELPSECVEESKNTIEANIWYEVSGNTIFTTNKNLSIEAIIGNNNEYGTKKTYEVVNIDNSEPSASIESISTTSNKAVIIASCEDLESGISKYEFSKDGSTWLTSETNNYTFDIDQNINYKFKVKCTNGSGISKEVESESEVSANKIIKPKIEQISQTPENSEYAQSRTIKITYDGTGIEKPRYYYSYDKITWIEVNNTTYEEVFTENKEIYAKTTDESGNESEYAWYKITNIDTSTPKSPTITANDGKASGAWHTSNTTLTFTGSSSNSGITYYYGTSINSMTNKGSSVTINNNTTSTTYYVKACSGSGICSGNSIYEVKLDLNNPTIKVTVSGKVATLVLGDNISIAGYGVNQSTGTQPSWTAVSGTSASKSWTASVAGNYVAWVKDTAGRTAYTSFNIAQTAFFTSKDFSYTGGVQSFTVPATGTYKLEVWGAEGGYDSEASRMGGKGGYSVGTKYLTAGTNLYVVVGGYPGAYVTYTTNPGGYNGGGASIGTADFRGSGGAGGGATHIAINNNRGILANYNSYRSEVLIVAGGGGGSGKGREDWEQERSYGGSGGGTNGGWGYAIRYDDDDDEYTDSFVPGGTQTSGLAVEGWGSLIVGTFGQGGGGNSWYAGGGGGGGWYGGTQGPPEDQPVNSGSGGSGYIGGVTGGSMQNGIRQGHGYARITLVN